jgi:hypothetical protein
MVKVLIVLCALLLTSCEKQEQQRLADLEAVKQNRDYVVFINTQGIGSKSLAYNLKITPAIQNETLETATILMIEYDSPLFQNPSNIKQHYSSTIKRNRGEGIRIYKGDTLITEYKPFAFEEPKSESDDSSSNFGYRYGFTYQPGKGYGMGFGF